MAASLNLDKLTRPNIHFINEKKRAEEKKLPMGMSTHYSSRFMLKKAEVKVDENDYLEYDSSPAEESKSIATPNIKQWVDYK
jgi:hypothetical protein